MGCAILGIGEHNGAVTTHKHTLDSALKLILGAFVAGQVELLGSTHVTGQFRLGIVLVQILGNHIVHCFQHGHCIGRLVGLDHKLACCLADEFFPLAIDSGGSVFAQGLVTLSLNSQGVGAGLQVLKHKHTIVQLVGVVCRNGLAVLEQGNNGAIDGCPLVHRACIVLVQVVDQMGMNILDGTHDVALIIWCQAKVLAYTAGDADTFLVAVVHVQRTVACWLIGVEVTLNQEAGSSMLQYTQVAGVGNAGVGIDTGR